MQDVPVDTIRLNDWPTARDLACRIGGPNPCFPPTAVTRRRTIRPIGGAPDKLDRYRHTLRLLASRPISRLSLPLGRAATGGLLGATGKKDVRGAYDCTPAR